MAWLKVAEASGSSAKCVKGSGPEFASKLVAPVCTLERSSPQDRHTPSPQNRSVVAHTDSGASLRSGAPNSVSANRPGSLSSRIPR